MGEGGASMSESSILEPFNYEATGETIDDTRLVKTCKFLLDHGADPNVRAFNTPDFPGALHMCASAIFSGFKSGDPDKAKLLRRRREAYLKCCRLLVDAGAEVNAEGMGFNALMLAWQGEDLCYDEDEGDDLKDVLQPGIMHCVCMCVCVAICSLHISVCVCV